MWDYHNYHVVSTLGSSKINTTKSSNKTTIYTTQDLNTNI